MTLIHASSADEAVLQRLRTLQYGEDAKVVMFTQQPFGLGAQLHRRILGLKLALMLDRKVVFPHLDEPPYTQVYQPVHSPFDYEGHLAEAPRFTFPYSQDDRVLFLPFPYLWETLAFRTAAMEYVPPELAAEDRTGVYFDGLLLSACHLTPELGRVVAEAKQRLGVGDRTLGVHIRRGDKHTETPYVPLDAIRAAIGKQLASGDFDSVFIATDDARSVDELGPVGVPVIYDAQERRYNNANHRFIMSNPSLAAQETATAVKNIYLLGACGGVIGQDNAHFPWLAAGMINFRTKQNRSVFLDGALALTRSGALRRYYRVKAFVQKSAKRLFPQLTLSEPTQRR